MNAAPFISQIERSLVLSLYNWAKLGWMQVMCHYFHMPELALSGR